MNVGYFHYEAWHVSKAIIKLFMFLLKVAPLVIQFPPSFFSASNCVGLGFGFEKPLAPFI